MPSRSKKPAPTPQFEWVALSAPQEEGAYASVRNATVASGKTCPVCSILRGLRTSASLGVESFPRKSVNALTLASMGLSLPAFSAEFLDLLLEDERGCFEWRPVHPWQRSQRRFFEMVPRVTVRPTAKAGVQFWTWQCPECEGMANMLWSPGYLNLPHFVSAADLPARPPALALGQPGAFELCLPAHRWQQMAKHPAAKGIVTSPVVVLPPEQVAVPEVFSRPEFDHLCELQSKEWERLRDQWLKSPEVLAMRADPKISDDAAWDFIHAQVDEVIALPRLNRSQLSSG